LKETNGDILLVSPVHPAWLPTRKGNRPSYIKAAKAELAIPIYEELISQLGKRSRQNDLYW
jgi:D-tyrosyl-tRNA(Tyr) deacylase